MLTCTCVRHVTLPVGGASPACLRWSRWTAPCCWRAWGCTPRRRSGTCFRVDTRTAATRAPIRRPACRGGTPLCRHSARPPPARCSSPGNGRRRKAVALWQWRRGRSGSAVPRAGFWCRSRLPPALRTTIDTFVGHGLILWRSILAIVAYAHAHMGQSYNMVDHRRIWKFNNGTSYLWDIYLI